MMSQINDNNVDYFKLNFYSVLRIFAGILFFEILIYCLSLIFPVIKENNDVKVWLSIGIFELVFIIGCVLFTKQKLTATHYIDWTGGILFSCVQRVVEGLSLFSDNQILKTTFIFFSTIGIAIVHVLIFYCLLLFMGKKKK